jgi:pimeloyl-ACP methyl ester carboxylesterase
MKNISRYISITCIALLLAACSRPTLDTYERFFFRTDGAELAVQVDGNRDSKVFILLLHGGPGGNGFEYNTGTYAEELEEKYAMVYLDQRGQGASQGNYDTETLTLQQFGDDIYNLSLLLKQKYGKDISIFLMGHSWGGTTGTYALLNTKVQEEIKGWIEVAGAHDIPLLNIEAIKMYLAIGNDEIAQGNNTDRWQEIVDFAAGVDTANISVDEGGRINSYGFEAEGLIEAVNESSGGTASHSFWVAPHISIAGIVSSLATSGAIHDETEAAAMTGRLDEITVPSLFLWGKYDFVVPPALGESAFSLVSSQDKELVVFERSGHSPMDTEPEGFVVAVEGFVERNK